MGQRPQTTILNLLDFARSIDLGSALLPPEAVRSIRASNQALMEDGRLAPGAMTELAWREREWFFAGPLTTGIRIGSEKDVPQGGVIRLIRARAKTAPSTGPCTIILHADDVTENVSIAKGAMTANSPAQITVAPGGLLWLDIIADGGAEDVTVTAFLAAGGTD